MAGGRGPVKSGTSTASDGSRAFAASTSLHSVTGRFSFPCVRRTCAVVQEAGLTAALEPEPGMAVETVADYLALRDQLGAAAPALCLDVGHLYVTGEGEPSDVIPGVANLLAQVHLEDMRRGIHEHLLPGQGEVDFVEVWQALTSASYQGAVCFELSRHSHMAPDALKICQVAWRSSHH